MRILRQSSKKQMRIDFMRFVDKYMGIPLCFIFTLYNYLVSFKREKKEYIPKKILFLKPSEMGTSVLLYFSFLKAKELFKDAKLYFLAFRENIDILYIFKEFFDKDSIFSIRTSSFWTFLLDNLRLLKRIWAEGIDCVIDCEFFSRYTALFSYLTGAKIRVGFFRFSGEGLYRGNLHTHKVPFNLHAHIPESFLCLVLALKKPKGNVVIQEKISLPLEKLPKITLSEERREKILQKLKKENPYISSKSEFIIFFPQSGRWLPFRDWPLSYFCELADLLLSFKENLFLILCGTCDAKEKSIEFFKNIKQKDRIIDLIGKTDIFELFDVFNIAKIVVGVDSGAVHFASLTDIYTICIFGPDTKEVFSPLSKNAYCFESDIICHPCFSIFNQRKSYCKGEQKKCLLETTPQMVFSKINEILTKDKNTRGAPCVG